MTPRALACCCSCVLGALLSALSSRGAVGAPASGNATATVIAPATSLPAVVDLIARFGPALLLPGAGTGTAAPPLRLPIPGAGASPPAAGAGASPGVAAVPVPGPEPVAAASGAGAATSAAFAVLGGDGPAYGISRSDSGVLQVEFN